MAMIDREVDALGDWLDLSGGVATTIGYRLEGSSSGVTVQIFDSTGRVVRTLDEGAREKGNHLIQWDGKDDSGNTLPNGRYTFSVTAGDDVGGDPISAFVRGTITGVSFEGGMPFLLMGNEKVPFANIMEIRSISKG
jgi:flagellar basal-body rod modification protein FlgD